MKNIFLVGFVFFLLSINLPAQTSKLDGVVNKYKAFAEKIGSPIIIISGFSPGEPNSASGIDCSVKFLNVSNIRIKYINFTVTPYNAVGDAAFSEIGHLSTAVLKYTGFLNPNEYTYCSWKPIWYNSTIKSLKLDKFEVIFDDNTNVVIGAASISDIIFSPSDWITFTFAETVEKNTGIYKEKF